MPTSLAPLLAGAAALAMVAASFPAQARDTQAHVMTVRLPDGGVARIAYTGDVPPQVVLAPAPGFPPGFAPMFAMPPPFAALEQASEAMERQADMMLREAAALPAAGLPPGVEVYTATTTINGNGACTRRTEISYAGGGAAPREISSLSGNCGRAPRRINAPAPAPQRQPGLIEARAQPAYRNLVKEAVWQSP